MRAASPTRRPIRFAACALGVMTARDGSWTSSQSCLRQRLADISRDLEREAEFNFVSDDLAVKGQIQQRKLPS
jgi:hypothetical protein